MSLFVVVHLPKQKPNNDSTQSYYPYKKSPQIIERHLTTKTNYSKKWQELKMRFEIENGCRAIQLDTED